MGMDLNTSEEKKQVPESSGDRNRAEGVVPEVNTDFMKEEIRQRPLNKKRLLRRTAITAFLAVLFGVVACAAFLILEPVINQAITPAEEPAPVTFPEEAAEDEVSPEDMIASDEEIQEAAAEKKAASLVDVDAIRKEVLEEVKKIWQMPGRRRRSRMRRQNIRSCSPLCRGWPMKRRSLW